MQLIARHEELIAVLQNKLSLTSSSIFKISIYMDMDMDVLCVDIGMTLMYKKENNRIVLRFVDVQEYSFYYLSHRIFYNVEILKFFKVDNLFYISFDPVDESEMINDEDQDFIKARSIEGYYC